VLPKERFGPPQESKSNGLLRGLPSDEPRSQPYVPERPSRTTPGPETSPLDFKCPDPKDPEFKEFYRSITDLNTDIAYPGAEKGVPKECPFTDKTADARGPRSWSPTTFTWKASGLCHKPLYFEDVQLERYGHSWGPFIQPVLSGAHFFLTVPILPYKMGLEPPHECVYTLGYYRPGSCAPYLLDPIPLSIRAGLLEAGAWIGGVAVIP
jgi:hypothetical protein